ncbi:hypothetical protein C8J34_106288 [Rhizobium sp. PP-F2F-G36]|nr:hypothetical protein C8J34_106288 [Rhizobium sp. PP-F2F-G36]
MNTRVTFNQVSRATSSDVFEIIPSAGYLEDDAQTVRRARPAPS